MADPWPRGMKLIRMLAVASGLLTVALLNLILVTANGRGPDWLFELGTDVFAWSMLASSTLLGWSLAASGHRLIGVAFLVNVAAGLIGGGMALAGVRLNLPMLFAADIYWLNLYLHALTKHWVLLTDRTDR